MSWAYLKLNELAQDQGKKMFYTDPSTNETVPDSDDEAAADVGEVWMGVERCALGKGTWIFGKGLLIVMMRQWKAWRGVGRRGGMRMVQTEHGCIGSNPNSRDDDTVVEA